MTSRRQRMKMETLKESTEETKEVITYNIKPDDVFITVKWEWNPST